MSSSIAQMIMGVPQSPSGMGMIGNIFGNQSGSQSNIPTGVGGNASGQGYTGPGAQNVGLNPANQAGVGGTFSPEAIDTASGVFGSQNARQAAMGSSGMFRKSSNSPLNNIAGMAQRAGESVKKAVTTSKVQAYNQKMRDIGAPDDFNVGKGAFISDKLKREKGIDVWHPVPRKDEQKTWDGNKWTN